MSSTELLEICYQLEGWEVFTALLALRDGHESQAEALAALRARIAERARERLEIKTLAGQPAVAGLRRLFRAAGCDPTRYRPSSEALLRRLLKGHELPVIHPLVDVNNCLSAELAVPCCVMVEGTFSSPLTLRSGLPGEAYESLRGPFKLEGRPLLADDAGPVDAPITGSRQVMVQPDSRRAWLAAYLPADAVSLDQTRETLDDLLRQAPVAVVEG